MLKERLESRRIVKDSLSIFINKVSAYWRTSMNEIRGVRKKNVVKIIQSLVKQGGCKKTINRRQRMN